MATAAPAAKTDAPPPGAAAPEASAPAPAAKSGGLKAWIPTLVAIVFAPAACWAVAQYVLMPQLKRSLLADVAEEGADVAGPGAGVDGKAAEAHAAGAPGGPHGKEGEGAAPTNSYRFENVVVNLAGTMGTRYLKTTFMVTGSSPDIAARFEAAKPQLVDVTIGVLSTLTLAELEEPGAKNVIREKLVNSYNQVLGQRVAEQVYFADFVVQ